MMTDDKINIVFTGFPYPHGMAGTIRNQHAIESLKQYDNVSIKVIVLRQAIKPCNASGISNGIPYETVGPNLFRSNLLLKSIFFFHKSKIAIKQAFKCESHNVLYVYGPPTYDNMPLIKTAKILGFKIIFDIVEDYDAAHGISTSMWQYGINACARHYTKQIHNWANGIIVVSKRLKMKYEQLTRGRVPLMLRPISVDTSLFEYDPIFDAVNPSLFYSGSFGVKDGIEYLIDAFEILAGKYPSLGLVMTGRGASDRILLLTTRITKSPFKERIKYLGYLDLEQYYHNLQVCGIPCMTRINSQYANAGFPFKLGEYLATGKPVIASKVSDVEDFLVDRENSILIAPESTSEIVDAVTYLLENPDIAIRIGENGRRTARKSFEYKSHGNILYNFISGLCVK